MTSGISFFAMAVIIVAAAFVGVLFFGMAGFVIFNIFRTFNRTMKTPEDPLVNAESAHAEKKRRVLEIVSRQSPDSPALKCRGCGATVDSTAELSADGKIRCNYCLQWTSIFQ